MLAIYKFVSVFFRKLIQGFSGAVALISLHNSTAEKDVQLMHSS